MSAGNGPKLRAFTVATGRAGYFDALEKSMLRGGVLLSVLGQGVPWQGFVWRLRLVAERLAALDPEQLVLVVDGYDTVLLSDADALCAGYERCCRDPAANPMPWRAAGGGRPLVLAPESPRAWCTFPYYHFFVALAKLVNGQPASVPYVLNAGVVLAPAATLRRYYDAIIAESEATGNSDDQWLLNRLYWSGRLPVGLAVDLSGAVAYCHTNRAIISCFWSTFRDQNSHKIRHEEQLSLEAEGGVRVRRSGARLGVLHGITNVDIDALCVHASLPPAKQRKKISQLWVRVFLNVMRLLIVVTVGSALYRALSAAAALGASALA